jgi:predicted dehydrogenase
VTPFGSVRSVHGEVDHRRGGPADDDVFVALQHESGVRSHIWATDLAAAPGPRLRVLGDRAAFTVEDLDGQEAALLAGARPGGLRTAAHCPSTRMTRSWSSRSSSALAGAAEI